MKTMEFEKFKRVSRAVFSIYFEVGKSQNNNHHFEEVIRGHSNNM